MILVDSSVWIDYFNGIINDQTDQLDHFLGKQMIITGDLILVEVLQGFKSDKDYSRALSIMSMLPVYNLLDREFAISAVEKYRYLRKKGITVRKTIDLIIASFCIDKNLVLLHNDKDFEPFESELRLKVVTTI